MDAFPIVDIIPVRMNAEDIMTTGLQDFIVYDVPNFATTHQLLVPALYFEISCGAVEDAHISFNESDLTYHASIHPALEDVIIFPSKSYTVMHSKVSHKVINSVYPFSITLS